MSEQLFIVFSTTPSLAVAENLAEELLNQRLCVCVNIFPGIRSHYLWQGQIEKAEECLMMIKCLQGKITALSSTLKNLHPYEVPEIVAISPTAVLPEYLAWARAEIYRQGDS